MGRVDISDRLQVSPENVSRASVAPKDVDVTPGQITAASKCQPKADELSAL